MNRYDRWNVRGMQAALVSYPLYKTFWWAVNSFGWEAVTIWLIVVVGGVLVQLSMILTCRKPQVKSYVTIHHD